jgi:acyl-CoA thioesterase
MRLEKTGESRFRSTFGAPFGNFVTRDGEQRPRAFGGHCFAQAAYAASKTVDSKYLIHVGTWPSLLVLYYPHNYID